MPNDILKAVHKSAKDLYSAKIINAKTMREYDKLCFPKIKKLTAKEIKQVRLHSKVSQPIFAQYLNISASTVKKWERGEKHPHGAALKLLNLVAKKGLSIVSD